MTKKNRRNPYQPTITKTTMTNEATNQVEDTKEVVQDTVNEVAAVSEAVATPEAEVIETPAEAVVPVEIPAATTINRPPVPHDPFELPLSCSTASRVTIQELKEYVTTMSGKNRLTPAVGGQAQSHLYHTLLQAINTPADDFDAVFGLSMKIIRANLSGVFSDVNVHRYTPHITLPAKLAAHFRYLISILTTLADPSLRQIAQRQINLDQAFRTSNIPEAARQRVLNFFNL